MLQRVDTVEEIWGRDTFQKAVESAGVDSQSKFREEFGQFLRVDPEQIRLMPNAHKGLEWLLKARTDSRRVVMAPAFNCSVVQNAITAAGYQSQLYDFSPTPGLFDWEDVINEMSSSVGVLIVTHYFGVPINFRPVIEHCLARGVTVIEDCAHALGAMVNDKAVGTLGDAAIFSFNYDKPISLGWGGLTVINTTTSFDLTLPVKNRIPLFEEELALWKQFIKVLESRRRMIPYQYSLGFRILRRLHMVKLKKFRKDTDIGIGAIQAELGRWCLKQYIDVVKQRNANAKRLSDSIPQPTWPVEQGVEPAWLKQKVFVQDIDHLTRLSKQLQCRGVRVGNFNWPRLLGGHATEYPVAKQAATLWIDVPIHQNLLPQALDEIIAAFKREA